MVTYAPMRINRILDIMSDNQLQVKVTSHETEELLDGLQKIANRVAFGIIDGSLIIGAALVMQYDVGPRLFGYPLISTLCFFAAAALGLYLLISMLLHDRHP
jgi:hypothetical protein